LNYVHIFSPRVLMELRAGYSRYHISSLPVDYGTNYSEQIGLLGSNVNADSSGLATFNPTGAGTGIGDSTYVPEYNIDNVYQGSGNISFEKGAHNIKAGGEYRRRQDAQWQSPSPAGFFNFSSEFTDDPSGVVANSGNAYASLLLGYPYSANRQLELVHPLYQFTESAVFVQDDWRVTKWLTLNAGVRWSYYSPLSEAHDRISNFDLSTAQVVIAGQNGISNTAGQQKDWRDFAPRFGFAATLSKSTVLRGGYGISYVPLMMGSNYAFRNPPFTNSWSETSSLFPTYSISQGLPPATPGDPTAPTGTFNAVAFNIRTPYVEQFNLTLERQLPGLFVLNLSYVGILGREQPFPNASLDYNAAAPSPLPNLQERRPYYALVPTLASLPVYGNYSNTSYNAFQATLQKRFQNGFDAVANYTWSHAIDDFDFLPTATGGYFVRGDSDLDVRQRFTLTANYVLPFAKSAKGLVGVLAKDWNVNAILQSQTGLPFTVTDAGDQANIGCSGQCLETPNLVGNPNVAGPVMANSNPACHSTVSQGGIAPNVIGNVANWFNPCAFQAQPFGTYGNLGKDTGRGPGLTQLDFSAFKDFSITEKVRLQFRGELFNILNHPNFEFTSATMSLGSGFGSLSSAAPPRNVQLALKLIF
jgi:outer membrane receptor protein involved in Fe transport